MKDGRGRLFYVIGPSGAGKDSFMLEVRKQLGSQVLVAHRYITRAASAGGENHVELSDEEFRLRQQLGLFALDWEANGHRYALGCELERWLASDVDVMVNGSRASLHRAQARFGEQLVPVMISVSPDILGRRLRTRGRESEDDIVRRLERARVQSRGLPDSVWRLDNGGPLAETLRQFQGYLQGAG
ncbi:ribose 1,5-bisphosphokinase [Oceanisphaera arctica]|uniref:Ribose 1,5-bisphosphate phosphokinase PhnN n=1 Tax=Oceanisphaera arctica TaxID=641510 RepID=A0A2P5TNQ8_9GAMM|nr:ribose 1,5-bisphosphokinase [Oceanisphaera arctica]PPL17230.1 phosphonate metabolism protein/1,5-bisphosphokinase (PRPP-forming) PhnN [Oceanisphaera arctica]GHA20417.1 ribose 1,5-bisphosphate phosphokinase PhnN [Oceanisphaera arctica]